MRGPCLISPMQIRGSDKRTFLPHANFAPFRNHITTNDDDDDRDRRRHCILMHCNIMQDSETGGYILKVVLK